MPHLLLILFYLAQLVQGTPSNTTDPGCPSLDGTTRSVWSILGSCAITLLICVWHAIHFDLDDDFMAQILVTLATFFVPEMVVGMAAGEWWKARGKVNRFREKGYQWSMTHSFFAEMGGFAYRDDQGGLRTIHSLEFLELCEANEIANPFITAKDIKDWSKSDSIGKAILVLQLLWFVLQVIVRGLRGFAVTLVELDTVSMAALSLVVILLWWDKPFRPGHAHIFYSPLEVKADSKMDSRRLSSAWKPEPGYLDVFMAYFACARKTKSITNDEAVALVDTEKKNENVHSRSSNLVDAIDEDDINSVSLCTTWIILGGLHLIAWNFDFPTETEKTLWRAASLALAGSPLTLLSFWVVLDKSGLEWWDWVVYAGNGIKLLLMILGVVSRVVLVALMLASLRALPPSAHQTVSWITYIPHL